MDVDHVDVANSTVEAAGDSLLKPAVVPVAGPPRQAVLNPIPLFSYRSGRRQPATNRRQRRLTQAPGPPAADWHRLDSRRYSVRVTAEGIGGECDGDVVATGNKRREQIPGKAFTAATQRAEFGVKRQDSDRL